MVFGETALEFLGGDIKYAEKVSCGGSNLQHGSGAHHYCVSGIAMLVSSFQDRAGRLELQVQKRDCFLQQFMLKLAFLMAVLTPFLLGGMFSGIAWFAGFSRRSKLLERRA